MSPQSLTNHPRADEAVDWIMEVDSAEQHARFSRDLEFDPALQRLTGELRDVLALVSLDVPQHPASAHLRQLLLEEACCQPQAQVPRRITIGHIKQRWAQPVAWAACFFLGAGCLWLASQRASLTERIAQQDAQTSDLELQLRTAKNAEYLANMQIDTLQATLEEYRQGVAVVVWDETTQEGVLQLEKMPPLPVGRDYQLWVIDPAHVNPVNAGIVRVDEAGFARVQFKPDKLVKRAEKFAVSVERFGGVMISEGPIVMVGP